MINETKSPEMLDLEVLDSNEMDCIYINIQTFLYIIYFVLQYVSKKKRKRKSFSGFDLPRLNPLLFLFFLVVSCYDIIDCFKEGKSTLIIFFGLRFQIR
jgi:hypothetical protein